MVASQAGLLCQTYTTLCYEIITYYETTNVIIVDVFLCIFYLRYCRKVEIKAQLFFFFKMFTDINVHTIGLCFSLGMYRDAEKQLMSSLKDQAMVETFLYMGKVYARMDQPISSVQSFERGLKNFPGETTLLTGIARIHEVTVVFNLQIISVSLFAFIFICIVTLLFYC